MDPAKKFLSYQIFDLRFKRNRRRDLEKFMPRGTEISNNMRRLSGGIGQVGLDPTSIASINRKREKDGRGNIGNGQTSRTLGAEC